MKDLTWDIEQENKDIEYFHGSNPISGSNERRWFVIDSDKCPLDRRKIWNAGGQSYRIYNPRGHRLEGPVGTSPALKKKMITVCIMHFTRECSIE